MVDPELPTRLRDAFGLLVDDAEPLHGGDEATVWKVWAAGEPLVIRVSPAWRTSAELERIYDVVAHVAASVPEALLPRRGLKGRRVVAYRGQPISVHPFVRGQQVDRRDPKHRLASAGLLAKIHEALGGWRGPSQNRSRTAEAPTVDASPLVDSDLDEWLSRLPSHGLARSLIHGDYYPRNVLWADGRIVAVLDWDDLVVDYREQEVAWSMWEFCHDDAGISLDLGAASDFLAAYEAAGGTVSDTFPLHASDFIRLRLRRECGAALAAQEWGEPFDRDYFDAEVEAFGRLKGLSIVRAISSAGYTADCHRT